MPANMSAAVVKANGYGLGMHFVASRLYQEGCRRFFVATVAEGVQVRSLLPDVHIYVLAGATRQTLDDLKTYQLTPVLNTRQQCELWSPTRQAAGRAPDRTPEPPPPQHTAARPRSAAAGRTPF